MYCQLEHAMLHAAQHGIAIGSTRMYMIFSAAHPVLLEASCAIVSELFRRSVSRSQSACLCSFYTHLVAL